MGLIRGDASEFYQLASDLAATSTKALPPLRAAMLKGGEVVRDKWKSNATATAGKHGKFYPSSIETKPTFGISTSVSVDIGPNLIGKHKQGGMSFEFGSENQPPHLDGLKALDASEAAVEGLVSKALDGLLP